MGIIKVLLVLVIIWLLFSILWPVILFLIIVGIIYRLVKRKNMVNINVSSSANHKRKNDDVMEAKFTEKEE